MESLTLPTNTPEETEELGKLLGSLLTPGMFIALSGDLGGGKTCFTRGIVAAMVPESAHLVASPTFAIMNEYPGAAPVYHFDFYRFSSWREIAELGFEDYFQGHGICIAEWAEKLEELLPRERLDICFAYSGENRRTITFTPSGTDHGRLLERLETILASRKTLTLY